MPAARRSVPACLLALALAVGAIAGPAGAAAKGVLPSTGASGGVGVTGPEATPASDDRYATLYSDGRGTSLLKIETDGGVIDRERWLDGSWALPAVTISGTAGGLSANGETLVLVDPAYGARAQETEFMVIDAQQLRTRERLTLDGAYSFDAISPNGRLMYLIEYRDLRDPFDYRVRAYDLVAGEFRPGAILDPAEPEEQMTGQPIARASSPDGHWAYTLYGGGEEAFIHALDTAGQTAVCVDLEQFGPQEVYRFGLDVDSASGEIAVLSGNLGGEPVATVDPESFAVTLAPTQSSPTPSDGDEAGAGGSLAWLVIGTGAALLGGTSFLLWHRRRPDALEEEELTRLVQDG
jgi:hypothetical protein